MFKEGQNLIDVATLLNLREKEVSDYYREYWNLREMYDLNQIYEEIGNEIWSVIQLHRRMKTEGLSPQQVSRILKTITTLEYTIRDLEGEEARLEVSNKQASKTFQQFTDSIQKGLGYWKLFDKGEIESLGVEKARLEYIINSIRLNNQTCTKIKQIVKQEVESIVSNPRRLIRLALASLFESSRKHPGKFQALYYNISSPLSMEQILSQSRVIRDPTSHGYSKNEDEKLLLDDAEQVYNSMMDAISNRCINEVPNDTESLSPILQLPVMRYAACIIQ